MNLCDLRPTAQTSTLGQFVSLLSGESEALPSCLTDEFLLSIARGIRLFNDCEDMKSSSHHLIAPVLLLSRINLGSDNRRLDFLGNSCLLYSAVLVYQIVLEREIIARIVGVRQSGDDQFLIDQLNELAAKFE